MEVVDYKLAFEIYAIVVFGALSVLCLLPVLAHHYERCLNGGNAGKHKVEQYKGIGVKALCASTMFSTIK